MHVTENRGRLRLRVKWMASTAIILAGIGGSPAFATDYVVGNEAELRSALASQANGDTITLTSDIILTAGGGGNLPAVHSNVTISGGGHTLSGGGDYRGLFVMSGTVRVADLKITDALAEGGSSLSGGSGAGLGGAIFVDQGATVMVSNVDLSGNEAKGGTPKGTATSIGGPGRAGGGMLGDADVSGPANQGSTGGGPNGGVGGTQQGTLIVTTTDSLGGQGGDGAAGSPGGTGGGGGGGAGGQGVYVTAPSGDAMAFGGDGGAGGAGGFGGGGGQGGSGSALVAEAHDPGIASGGGGDGGAGGAGGFGGGGGTGGHGSSLTSTQIQASGSAVSSTSDTGTGGSGGQAGFGGSGGLGGGGAPKGATVGDGTGAGMGGALFVREGGTLIVEGNLTLGGNSAVAGGAGSQAFGSGIFLQGQGNLNLSPEAGETQTVSDVIADQKGVVDNGYVPPSGTYLGTESWSLTKQGTGKLVLSGANLYAGGTTISNGILALSGTGTLGLASNTVKVTGGQLDLGGTSQVQNGGALLWGGAINNGTLQSAGLFDLRAGTVSATLAGSAGLTKTTVSTVILTGNNTYSGATSIEGGVLIVNGSIGNSSATNVLDGATLGGIGTVSALMVASGGTLRPNDTSGSMKVAGNLAFHGGSTYSVILDSSGLSDSTEVTGTVDIGAGAHLVMAPASGSYQAGTRYTIIDATGLVTGTFADLTGVTDTAFLTFADAYDVNHVYLDVVQARAFAEAGITPNQIATASGVDSLDPGNPLAGAIAGLATDAEARNAFDQLSGEIHASAKGMLVEDSRFVRDAATSRIRAAFGDSGTTAAIPVMAYGEGGPEMVAADTDRFAVWGQAFGSWGNADTDGNAAAFDRLTGGLLAGADTLVGGWRVGLLGGYSHSSFDADDRNSGGDADNYHLGLYGGTNWGAIAFRTGAAYSWSSLSTKRLVAFDGFADALSADYDAGTAQIFGELAYKADAGQFKFEPFANLAYVSVHTDGFTETGGDAALTSASTTTDATSTTLGLRGSTDFALASINATARGMLGWRHAFGDVTPTSTFAFAGSDAFTIAGVPIARDSAVLEAGIDLKMSTNATLGLSYSGQFGSGNVDNGAKLDLSMRF